MSTLAKDRALGASAMFCLALALCCAFGASWLGWVLIPLAWVCIGACAGGEVGRVRQRRQLARAQDVATLERAEAVLTALDDEPPPLPPAIPMEMRDPAFQRWEAELERLKRQHFSSVHSGRMRAGVDRYRLPLMKRWDLQNQPLIADRRFTLTTHCQHGHVGDHWLGRITTDHVERICRFERCAATWLEHR